MAVLWLAQIQKKIVLKFVSWIQNANGSPILSAQSFVPLVSYEQDEVLWIWHLCDNDIVSQSNGKMSELSSVERMAHLSEEHLYFDALWVKVMRALISPELVWTSYNVAFSLCCVLWNVTSLSMSRISSFKRSWELLTGVSTCLYDMWITRI